MNLIRNNTNLAWNITSENEKECFKHEENCKRIEMTMLALSLQLLLNSYWHKIRNDGRISVICNYRKGILHQRLAV